MLPEYSVSILLLDLIAPTHPGAVPVSWRESGGTPGAAPRQDGPVAPGCRGKSPAFGQLARDAVLHKSRKAECEPATALLPPPKNNHLSTCIIAPMPRKAPSTIASYPGHIPTYFFVGVWPESFQYDFAKMFLERLGRNVTLNCTSPVHGCIPG